MTETVTEVPNVLRPLGERIIVYRKAETQRGGILIPDSARKTSLVGKVVHVGPDVENVKPGDMILFAQYSPWQFPVDGKVIPLSYEDHLLMNAEDVLCVLEPESKGGVPA